MKTITRLGSIIAVFTLLTALAPAASAAERAKSKYFRVTGKVIQKDKKERTLLVTDRDSKKLYLIEVPELTTFKITFGRYMRLERPEFKDVRVGERIEIRCKRNDRDHLTRLDDGRLVTQVTAAF
jgi:hypothetical protein